MRHVSRFANGCPAAGTKLLSQHLRPRNAFSQHEDSSARARKAFERRLIDSRKRCAEHPHHNPARDIPGGIDAARPPASTRGELPR
jgi:hypothetical protein